MVCKTTLQAALFAAMMLAIVSGGMAQEATPAKVNPEPRRSNVFDVRDYGAVADGKTLDTQAISKAIYAAAAAGGGRVVFSPGVYSTGTFELLSNVTLDVEAGAIIQGSKDVADYGSIAEYGFGRVYGLNSSGEGEKVGIIVARNAENIAIVGQGVIDGSGDEFFDFKKPHYGLDFDARYTRQGQEFMKSILATEDGPVKTKDTGRPGTMIISSHSRNIVVRDVTFRNAPNWTFHLASSQSATVSGIHILNSLLLPNNDGIDCFGCRDVHFSDCEIKAGDDDFAFFGSEDVSVTNCSLASHSSGIRLENTRYSTFTNLSIHSNRGIGIYEREGITANLVFSDITIETQLLTGHWWGKAEPIFIAIGPPRQNGKHGTIRDVRFANIIGEVEGGIVMYGDSGSLIQNVFLDQVKFKIRAPRKHVGDLAGGNFDFRWTATSPANAVFKHDIPGMYCRYIDGLPVHGLTLEWANDLPDYFSDGIECEDFNNLDLEGFEGRQAPTTSANAAIVLRRGHGVSIRNSKAAAGTSTFLSTAGVTGEGLFAENDLRSAKRVFGGGVGKFVLFGNALPAIAKRPVQAGRSKQ